MKMKFTKLQLTTLVVLRIVIGWHCLYEGVTKLMNPGWTSAGYLSESKWILSGFSSWIINHGGVLSAVDFLNAWGLVAIGAGLILGLLARPAAIAGTILLMVYYLCNPPLIGLTYSVPLEGSNLVVSKTLIEAVAMFVLVVFPTSKIIGLDMFLARTKYSKEQIKIKETV
jgi:thiosulfate dehydrogenase [quinone] large subunit